MQANPARRAQIAAPPPIKRVSGTIKSYPMQDTDYSHAPTATSTTATRDDHRNTQYTQATQRTPGEGLDRWLNAWGRCFGMSLTGTTDVLRTVLLAPLCPLTFCVSSLDFCGSCICNFPPEPPVTLDHDVGGRPPVQPPPSDRFQFCGIACRCRSADDEYWDMPDRAREDGCCSIHVNKLCCGSEECCLQHRDKSLNGGYKRGHSTRKWMGWTVTDEQPPPTPPMKMTKTQPSEGKE